jgi:CHAT domain-containing protein
LYEWLIAPVVADLRRDKVTTLIFVPDGPLRGIPPAALYDGKRFLIEEFSVSTTLGLTLTSPRPIARDSVRVLAGGLTVSRDGFSQMPGVAAELDEVARIYESTELRDDKFRVDSVTDELSAGNYSVVHIATHGQFNRDFHKSFLLAYDGRITMDALEQMVGLRRFQNEPVELLMLSACETAAGDDQAALGLAGVALKAGARSAVATLWSVYDEATAQLVGTFYERLQDKNLSKAEALRQAQLGLLRDPRYAHPAVWSPFLLLGNWL